MEAICATGIRVSEVKYLTMEAARRGRAEVSLKGKIRTILIPGKLCRKLLQYGRAQKIGLRRDLSHQKRQRHIQKAGVGGDESGVPEGRSGRQQGVSP